MNNCPICSGQLVTRVASTGDDTWCNNCRRIIASSSLGFTFQAADANIEQCSIDGLPGWKGPGEDAKCYIYEPGNPESESHAQQKAKASAYSSSKFSYIQKLSLDYFEGPVPAVTLDPDGVVVQPLSDQNKEFGLASKNPSVDHLGRSYCTNCGQSHEGDCPNVMID